MKKIRFNPRPTKEESDVVEAECRKMFDLKPVQVVKKPKRKPYTLHWVTTDPYRCHVIAVTGDLMAARADTMNIDLPTKTLEDGSVETDFSFEAISDFIDENKDDYYEERRLFG